MTPRGRPGLALSAGGVDEAPAPPHGAVQGAEDQRVHCDADHQDHHHGRHQPGAVRQVTGILLVMVGTLVVQIFRS